MAAVEWMQRFPNRGKIDQAPLQRGKRLARESGCHIAGLTAGATKG
jgi:hypothetical protein